MSDLLTGIVGEEAAPIAAYILIFILLLIGFFVLRASLRQMRGGTFVNGGRGRKQRLAIIDATPVDNRRRLVLVRRDDVEHLVLIGGMNDLVVERDIGLQSMNKIELPTPTPNSNLRQIKVNPSTEPANSAPPPNPLPKHVPVEQKPQPSPAINTPKVERPSSPQIPTTPVVPPVAPLPVTKDVEATAVPSAAAAITGLADTQFSQELESAAKEVVKPVQMDAPPSADPAVGPFSAYAEQESTGSEVAIEVQQTEKSSHDSIDEFMPINAPNPTTKSIAPPPPVPPVVEPQVKEDDTDLEDEMEQLLNKLTKPSTL